MCSHLNVQQGCCFGRKKYDGVKLPSGAMAEESTHPSGITVKIVGIERGDHGRSCEEHDVCGTVVEEDTLLHLRKDPSTIRFADARRPSLQRAVYRTRIVCDNPPGWTTRGMTNPSWFGGKRTWKEVRCAPYFTRPN